MISQPLVVSDHLFLPQGSRLKGSVLESRPARRLGRNGQLRIVFHQVVPPNGIQQTVEASLEGVAVAKGEHLSLDSEGGAQVTHPENEIPDHRNLYRVGQFVDGGPRPRCRPARSRRREVRARAQPTERPDFAFWARSSERWRTREWSLQVSVSMARRCLSIPTSWPGGAM